MVFWCVNGIKFFTAVVFSHVHWVRLIVKFGEGKEFPSGVYWQLFFSCFCLPWSMKPISFLGSGEFIQQDQFPVIVCYCHCGVGKADLLDHLL